MKKVLFLGLLMLVCQITFSQSLRFGGNMNDKVWSQLTTKEKNLFYDCVKECGLNKDSIVWVSNERFHLILEDDNKLNIKVVRKHTDGVGDKVIDYKSTIGRNLDTKECMVFIDRSEERTEIVFQMYH
jgi:hypothetical protein